MEKKLREKALGAAEDETLFPLWWTPALFPSLLFQSDEDDVVGFVVRKFSCSDLLAAGTDAITFSAKTSAAGPADPEGSYTIIGTIRRTYRLGANDDADGRIARGRTSTPVVNDDPGAQRHPAPRLGCRLARRSRLPSRGGHASL